MIKVVSKRGNRTYPNSIYIGRPSTWGNPFEIGKDGTREEVVKKYKEYMLANPELIRIFKEQVTRMEKYGTVHLVCWCAPLSCHGDVLKELVS